MSGMKNLDFALLLEVYECMLTDRQRELMEFYYWEDMSLGEISQYLGITRQAVRDGIKRSEQLLTDMEEKLKLAEKIVKCREMFGIIADYAGNTVSVKNTGTELKETLKKIHDIAVSGREMFS